MAGIIASDVAAGPTGHTKPVESAESLWSTFFSDPGLAWLEMNVWVKTAVVLIGALILYVFVRHVVLRRLARLAASTENDVDDRLIDFARSFFGLTLLFLTILFVLRVHHVSISPLLAGAGIAGIAVGLAAKETLADILAGVFLVVDRPLRVGDRVKIERPGRHWGGWGDVVDVGLRRTLVRNTDGVVINYPNSVLAGSVITNFSHDKGSVRVRVRFQVDYSADLDKASTVGEAAIERSKGVISGTPQIVVRSLWDDSRGHLLAGVLLEGRYRIEDVRDRTRIRSGVLKNLLADLRTAEIPLPAPRVRIDGPA
jgi:small-conductance mechanosensitive channel